MVVQVVNQGALRRLYSSQQGPLAKQMLRRGIRIQTQAKKNLSGGTGSGPKRVDTGLLRSRIDVQFVHTAAGTLAVRVGTNVYYGYWIHEGTGLFGPRHQRIYPKRARYLRFKPKGAKKFVYRRSVAGIKPNRYLTHALHATNFGRQKSVAL